MTSTGKKPLKAIAVFGTRPEAIKMAPVLKEISSRPSEIEFRLAVTAQHRDLLDQVLDLFGLKPDLDLDIMVRGQTLSQITTAALEGLSEYFILERPGVVLVHGDTTTTFTAALAAFYCGIPVAHVEAGLRTGNRFMPYPEEMNRRLTDELASIFLAPTKLAKSRLLEREIPAGQICVTGNTVVDALHGISSRNFEFSGEKLNKFASSDAFKVLFTMHRRESWGDKMRHVFESLAAFLKSNGEILMLYPVHPNPAVSELAYQTLGSIPNVLLVPACDYASFVHLLKASDLIISDSGGIQEEAPSFGIYTLVMRDATERPEVVEAGFAELCGADGDRLVSAIKRVLPLVKDGKLPLAGSNPIGDGLAAKRTVDFLLFKFGYNSSPPQEFGG
jgi:UDP-N-acetylglucosamine 2-epimerase (non-hydrolysing)